MKKGKWLFQPFPFFIIKSSIWMFNRNLKIIIYVFGVSIVFSSDFSYNISTELWEMEPSRYITQGWLFCFHWYLFTPWESFAWCTISWANKRSKMTGFCCIPYGNQTSSRWYLRFPTAIKQTAAVPLQNNTANSFPANDRHRSFSINQPPLVAYSTVGLNNSRIRSHTFPICT